jgi:hypothetical protein
MTIHEKYVIYDWSLYYASVKWLYVVISRCSNIDNVYFYDGEDNKKPLNQTVNISSYKQQDKKAGRIYDEKEYIDYNWINL